MKHTLAAIILTALAAASDAAAGYVSMTNK